MESGAVGPTALTRSLALSLQKCEHAELTGCNRVNRAQVADLFFVSLKGNPPKNKTYPRHCGKIATAAASIMAGYLNSVGKGVENPVNSHPLALTGGREVVSKRNTPLHAALFAVRQAFIWEIQPEGSGAFRKFQPTKSSTSLSKSLLTPSGLHR